jgi:hypothetical protein
MEHLEQSLIQMEDKYKDFLSEQAKFMCKNINKLSGQSIKIARTFDAQFNYLFQMNIGKLENCNPSCIVEIRDGKPTQVIDVKLNELLSDRLVMGRYYLDTNNKTPAVDYTLMTCKQCHNIVYYSPMNGHLIHIGLFGNSTCNNNNISNYEELYMIKRNEINKINIIATTYEFEIDNYLNLYNKNTGLYLMFNKTAFPELPFYLAKKYTQIRDENDIYYKIFFSKQLGYDLTSTTSKYLDSNHYYKLVDNRLEFFKAIENMIPSDYQKVYEFFNKFRKFDNYNIDKEVILHIENSDNEDNCLDGKDRMIREMKYKLLEMTSRNNKKDEIIREMIEKYREQSIEIENLNNELNLSKLRVEEEKQNQNKKLVSEIENIKREKYGLYQQILEVDKYISLSKILQKENDTIKIENENLNLKIIKLQNINNGLVDGLKLEKERNKNITIDLSKNNLEIIDYKNNEQTIKNINSSLESELEKYKNQNRILEDKLSEIANQSSNMLELALLDKITELEKQVSKLKDEIKNINQENKKLKESKQRIDAILSTLSE